MSVHVGAHGLVQMTFALFMPLKCPYTIFFLSFFLSDLLLIFMTTVSVPGIERIWWKQSHKQPRFLVSICVGFTHLWGGSYHQEDLTGLRARSMVTETTFLLTLGEEGFHLHVTITKPQKMAMKSCRRDYTYRSPQTTADRLDSESLQWCAVGHVLGKISNLLS